MPIDVAVYILRGRSRSQVIGRAMAEGIKRVGDRARVREDHEYIRPDAPVALFYGYEGMLPKVMRDYRDAGLTAVYLDLGYWGRREGGRLCGYHKIAVNERHPTKHFQIKKHDHSRSHKFGLVIQPWRSSGNHILLAGMGDKAAVVCGLKTEQWERATISQLRQHTQRPIVYRPKPSWSAAKPIEGTTYSPHTQPLTAVLQNCHAIVTHHSNVAVDGLIAGIPSFCWEGVATPLSKQWLHEIEGTHAPLGREQWVADIAWTQFNVDEMKLGHAWHHLKSEGLVPQ